MASSGVRVVPPSEAKALAESGHVFLDVRTPKEYESGHVAGSVNIPLMLSGPDGSMVRNGEFLDQVKAKYPPTTALVLACRSGKRSNMAANELSAAGFISLVDVEGGMIAWENNKLPTTH